MGRPRKKDPALVKVSEALGITLASDVMTLEDLEGFPDLDKESLRDQGILLAYACGYGTHYIGKMFGIDRSTAWRVIQRVDPEGRLRLGKNAKKAYMTKLYEMRAIEALSSITPEKFEEATAGELMRVAKMATDASASLNQSKHRDGGGSRLDRLLEAMVEEQEEGNVDDVEYEVSDE